MIIYKNIFDFLPLQPRTAAITSAFLFRLWHSAGVFRVSANWNPFAYSDTPSFVSINWHFCCSQFSPIQSAISVGLPFCLFALQKYFFTQPPQRTLMRIGDIIRNHADNRRAKNTADKTAHAPNDTRLGLQNRDVNFIRAGG